MQLFVFEGERFLGGEIFDVGGGLVLGRHHGVDLRLDADTVSREHVRLWLRDEEVVVEDLGSANGTWIDRRKLVRETVLGPRAALRMGPYTVRARALRPEPVAKPYDVASAEAETKLEAQLGTAEGATFEFPGVGAARGSSHLRLVEAARERAAGASVPSSDPAHERRVRHLDDIIARLDDRPPSRLPWTDEPTSDTEALSEELPAPNFSTREFARDLASSLAVGGRLEPIEVEVQIDLSDELQAPFEVEEALVLEAADLMGTATKPDVILEPVRPCPLDDEETEAELEPAAAQSVPPLRFPPDAPEPSRVGMARVNARLVTPSALRVSVEPMAARPISVQAVPRVAMDPPKARYEGIEVMAEKEGRLMDIAVLRESGQQYVLGHMTPQGNVAPHDAHAGLRLVRRHGDGRADLVFPADVNGHLNRGDERVPLQHLTEGRKYSCLRLEPGDEVDLWLGRMRYRVSFRARPALRMRR